MDKKVEHAWSIFKNQQEIIKFFDKKINALLFVSSVISTFILINAKEILANGLYGQILIFGYLLFFILFIAYSLFTILPRNPLKFGKSIPKLIYFKDIANRVEPKDYVEDFESASIGDIQNDLCYQIYELGTIAKLKSINYSKAWVFMALKLLLFSFCAIYQNMG